MELTEENKQEIETHIWSACRYGETFNEVYDHVVSALAFSEKSTFNGSLVTEIIRNDFGGLEQIKEDEKEYEKTFVRSCMHDLKGEIISSFKFPRVWFNVLLLVFCLFADHFSRYIPIGIMQFVTVVLVSVIAVSLIFLFYRYLYRRTQKPSIKIKVLERALGICTLLSYNVTTLFLGKNAMFDVSSSIQILVTMAMFLALFNFLFAYSRVYKKRLRILV